MSYLGRSAKLSLKAQEKVSFLATAGQTVKTGLSYTPSFVEVYVNGVLLTDTTDFTATNGNSITFTVALLLNDEVTVISLKTFTVADTYTKSDANTLLAAKAKLTKSATAPSSPAAGDMWFDTTSGVNAMKVYNGTVWKAMSEFPFAATGGTITTVGGYKIHTFTSSGTFTANQSGTVEYLVIAGGGSGGGQHGGGGGAGGYRTATGFIVSEGANTVTVGAGGAAVSGASSPNTGANGSNSVFSTITSIGGGAGQGWSQGNGATGNTGGSGGGASLNGAGGAGTSGQGNAGGSSTSSSTFPNGGGGGGGAGSVGGTSINLSRAGNGGSGLASSISGTSVTRAGGGGGASHTPHAIGTGGSGGGGNGGLGNSGAGINATINTGSGGGGSGSNDTLSGAGGSGIVIVRYAI